MDMNNEMYICSMACTMKCPMAYHTHNEKSMVVYNKSLGICTMKCIIAYVYDRVKVWESLCMTPSKTFPVLELWGFLRLKRQAFKVWRVIFIS